MRIDVHHLPICKHTGVACADDYLGVVGGGWGQKEACLAETFAHPFPAKPAYERSSANCVGACR